MIKVVSFAIFISVMCELLPGKHEGQLCSFYAILLVLTLYSARILYHTILYASSWE